MRGFFVTGTGTSVGKTFVTAALARRARARGLKVFAFKPIETGCERRGADLLGVDQQLLFEASGGWQTGAQRGVYRFEAAVAPAVAAADIALAPIRHVLEETAPAVDLVLVEGAGGWRVPINDREDMSDLAQLVALPVIVVGLANLGTINHCLLTIEAIEKTSSVAWVVLSQRPEDDAELVRSNCEQIARRWTARVAVVGSVPRETELDRILDLN